jgi:hypothetical protein
MNEFGTLDQSCWKTGTMSGLVAVSDRCVTEGRRA